MSLLRLLYKVDYFYFQLKWKRNVKILCNTNRTFSKQLHHVITKTLLTPTVCQHFPF